ncbi:MAG: WXG100 family type VII secretion target, partial [Pseudonocardiaceae bacterium]
MTSAIAEASDKADEIEQKIREFFDAVNDTISWVPWPLSDLIEPIEQGMENLSQEIQRFWDEVTEPFRKPGNPDRLRQAGMTWSDSVGDALGEIAGNIGLQNHQTNLQWTGSAAEAYKALVPAQVDALNGLKNLAEKMRTSLDDLAESVEDFWLMMKIAFASFAAVIIGALVSAFFVVTIPAAIGVIIAACTAAVVFVGATINALDGHLDVIRDQQTAVVQGIQDVGTRWEASNIAGISDASVTDGDASDW